MKRSVVTFRFHFWLCVFSYTELWIPEGSPAPTMKLCLGMLMKDGVPRYALLEHGQS